MVYWSHNEMSNAYNACQQSQDGASECYLTFIFKSMVKSVMLSIKCPAYSHITGLKVPISECILYNGEDDYDRAS